MELAYAAEQVDPIVLDPGEAIYVESDVVRLGIIPGEVLELETESVSYLLLVVEKVWDFGDGTMIVESTVGTPTFFDSDVELAYYNAGHDKIDRVGESFEEAFSEVTNEDAERDWPTNPDALHQTMVEVVNMGGSTLPDDVLVFHLARQILFNGHTQPMLRSAVLEVLATLDLTVIEDPTSETLTVTTTYEENGATVTEYVTFDANGYVIADGTTADTPFPGLHIPPGSVIGSGRYTIPTQVIWENGSS
jgi:hypothetical protein